jgi:hypothetical protein
MENQIHKKRLTEECGKLDQKLERELTEEILAGEFFGGDVYYRAGSEHGNKGNGD